MTKNRVFASLKMTTVALLTAFCLLPAALARATTVTGTVHDSTGAAVSGASISFRLINIGRGNVARVAGTSIVAPELLAATTAADGAFTATITGNDAITPAGTLYEVVIRGPGFTYGPFDYSITGGAADLNSLTPVATFPNTSSQVAASQLVPPSGCASGQVLEWTGTAWQCAAAAGGSSLDIETNGASNASQDTLNFLPSSADAVGLTLTPVYQAGGGEKFEITGGSYAGNAATATALASAPAQCSAGQFATGIAASGNANCSTPPGGSPAGASGQVQINSSGAFGGAANLTYDSASGNTTLQVQDKGGQVYNVKAYGAKGDGVFLYTCSATNGSTTVTCTDGEFAAADVGKTIEIDNAVGSQPDITTIASVTDGTHVVVTVAPAFTIATTNVVYGTDDTTAIQTLINTVFAAGGGTIFFPTANYILAGALGGPDTQNGILYIPQIDTSSSVANPFPTLTLAGPGTPSTETLEAPYATFKPTTSSAVLYGMTWGNGAGAIISGPTATPFDSCTVVLKDLSLRTRQNPDITGLQFQFVKNAIIRRVSAGVNISSSINVPQPTFTTVAGIKMPTTASSGVKDVDGYWAYGFYTGLEVSEHANIRNYEGHQLFYGLTIDSNAVHAVFLSNVNIEASKHVLNIGGPTPVFGTVDVEHETSGWYTAIDDLIVSSTIANQARGALFMTVYRPGTGYVSPTMTVLPRYISVWAYGFGQVGGLNYDAAFTFAQISATPVINGARLYCSDCKNVATDGATFDSAIASGGTGTPVVGENGAWRVR